MYVVLADAVPRLGYLTGDWAVRLNRYGLGAVNVRYCRRLGLDLALAAAHFARGVVDYLNVGHCQIFYKFKTPPVNALIP